MSQSTMTETFAISQDESRDMGTGAFESHEPNPASGRHLGERRYVPIEAPDLTSEFDYKPVPILAPVSLFLGAASVMGFFGVVGVAIALLGTMAGGLCLIRILRSGGELGGKWLALAGWVLSFVFLIGGTATHVHAYATEVPEGYTRVNFTADIAKKAFQVKDGQTAIHSDVQALDGKPIFLKGYMYPELQTEDLTRFVLVKDNLQCCFGGNPAPTDMILVEMKGPLTADYSTGLVAVAGTFRALAPQKQGPLQTVYELEATHFSQAKTSF